MADFTEYFKDTSKLNSLKKVTSGINFNDKFLNLKNIEFPNTVRELEFVYFSEKHRPFPSKAVSNIEKLCIRIEDEDILDFEYCNSLDFTNIEKIELVFNDYDIESMWILNFNKIFKTLKEIKKLAYYVKKLSNQLYFLILNMKILITFIQIW